MTSEAGTPPMLLGSDRPLRESHDLALLDLDGVVYIGPHAVPGAASALEAAREVGMRLCFVTNNASRPPEEVAKHLRRLGVPAETDDVLTSAQVAAALLARRLAPGAPVLVIGGLGLERALAAEGLRAVSSLSDDPAAVVQGFSPDVGWRQLAEGSRGVRSGLLWVATNRDPTVPTPYGPAPGNGTLVAAVAVAAGREPDEVAGKPDPGPFLEAARRLGGERPLVVGDRLDTDLEGARAAKMPGLLVLTGVTGAADLLGCPPHRRPDYIGRDLSALAELQPPCEVEAEAGSVGGRAVVGTCRAAIVRVDAAGVVVVEPGADPLDLLRAACTATWAWSDRVDAEQSAAGGQARRSQDSEPAVRPGIPDAGPVTAALRLLDSGATWAR